MLRITAFEPGRNAAGQGSTSNCDHRPAEPRQGGAQLSVSDIGEPLVERRRLASEKRWWKRAARRHGKRQGPLHEDQAGHGRMAEEDVDALDQQRRAVLQFECGSGRRAASNSRHGLVPWAS
jgi:hypothetical protein